MTKRMIIMLVCVAVVFGGIFGYKAFVSHMIQKAMSNMQQPAQTVSTTTAKKETWQPELKAVGTVRALQGVNVTTEIPGLVRTIFFESGQNVKEGEKLVQLNAEADRALLHSLQAQAELAHSTYQRDKQQFAVKAISKANLDVAMANLKSKQAQVAQQEALVEKKTIRAPFSGRIGINLINVGQYLNPGEQIATLQSFDTVYVDFLIPQQESSRIDTGQTVSATTNTYPDRTFKGRITAIDPRVNPQTRNIKVEATLANPDLALLPGMFLTVKVQAGTPQQYITLPRTAVTFNPYSETVYVVEEKQQGSKKQLIAKQTFVTTGATRGDQVAVTEGIEEGQTVVTSGQLKLHSGSPIKVNNEIQPSNEPNPRPKDE